MYSDFDILSLLTSWIVCVDFLVVLMSFFCGGVFFFKKNILGCLISCFLIERVFDIFGCLISCFFVISRCLVSWFLGYLEFFDNSVLCWYLFCCCYLVCFVDISSFWCLGCFDIFVFDILRVLVYCFSWSLVFLRCRVFFVYCDFCFVFCFGILCVWYIVVVCWYF